MSSAPFDPYKIIDFNKDYYAILGLDKLKLPFGTSRAEKMALSKELETAFRQKARICHPDFGGSKEAFLDVNRARQIIEDPLLREIFHAGPEGEKPRYVGDGQDLFEVDWSKLGTYRKGTPEDTVGFTLFLDIADRKKELELVPAFFPELPEHNYQWDFALPDKKVKLAVAIVNDGNEVLRLTSGEQIEESLPFKIFICIPRASLFLMRDQSQRVEMEGIGKTLINGQLLGASYSDFNLLETTSLQEAQSYVAPGGKLERDLIAFRDGSMIAEKARVDALNKQNTWMGSDKMNEIDREKLKAIIRLRSIEVIVDEKAAEETIDRLPGLVEKQTVKKARPQVNLTIEDDIIPD